MTARGDAVAWPRTLRIARAVVLAVIIAPVLAALALLACATLMHRPRPVDTGDVLLDACLQALVDCDTVADPQLARGVLLDEYSPDDVKSTLELEQAWCALEQRFGSDPRFWMVCRYLRLPVASPGQPGASQYTSATAGVQLSRRWWFLEQARARGAADWRVLLQLLRAYDAAWREEARRELALPQLPRNAGPEQKQEQVQAIASEVRRRHGAVREQLRSELLAAGGGQAQVRFQLALLACDDGAADQALTQLRLGNAAAGNESGIGTPFKELWEQNAQGRMLGGDSIISGYLEQATNGSGTGNFIKHKQLVSYLACTAAKRGDNEALSVLYQACCRQGSAQGSTALEQLVAVIMLGRVVSEYTSQTPHPLARTAARLSTAAVERAKLRSTLHNLPQYTVFNTTAQTASFKARLLESQFSARAVTIEINKLFGSDGLQQQAALEQTRRQFIELARGDPWAGE